MTFWKRQNNGYSKMIRGGQDLEGERNEDVEHRGFLGQGNYSVTLEWCIHVTIHLSKHTECATPRVNYNAI